LGAATLATAGFGAAATAGFTAGLAAALGAAFAVAGFAALDFAAGLGLEAAVAGFGDADLDVDGDLAMYSPTPRLERTHGCALATGSIRNSTGV